MEIRRKVFGNEFAPDREQKEVYMVRLRPEDRLEFDSFKEKIGIKEDSKAFKIALKLAFNVIQNQFLGIEMELDLKRKRSNKEFFEKNRLNNNTIKEEFEDDLS
jgi:hypothetical protein